jgi:hypothetical protein
VFIAKQYTTKLFPFIFQISLYHYIFLYFVIISLVLHLCWFCHTSAMPVPPSYSFSLMCPALHSLFFCIYNIVWWTPAYLCG